MRDMSYDAVMARNGEIMKKALGVDYSTYESGNIAFDYECLMADTGLTLDDVRTAQRRVGVGDTPLLELRNLTALARAVSGPGLGARILVKDEQCNPSGSFKDRRASMSVLQAKQLGFPGVMSATSGNYGAAVASQAAMANLPCIIVQECYDSHKVGQPEILEKQRKCESLGAEVLQLSVGPELFYSYLKVLEETGFFNASLYSAFGIAGVETLGLEIVEQCQSLIGRAPDVVIATNAGGGNLTGTARGLRKAGASDTKVYGASVDLSGLHMASDHDFNLKSFTTGHTGFGVPYATNPDHSDVPRSAARPLRYMDGYLYVKQGEVFYMTELLAQLEGMERGPAGNTSLAAAFALAQTLPSDQAIVVQETEYTGAGKHPLAQLSFAKHNGIEVSLGDPETEVPGRTIVMPDHPSRLVTRWADLDRLRRSYVKQMVRHVKATSATEEDIQFLIDETQSDRNLVLAALRDNGVEV
ncbi:2-amino-4-oxopentanoate thiolase subunit OrtB [Cutibacterium granulosum]|uniref:2-amino-4-oxopentanoate thiolase subunit OrtB n=2 Tax=Cutibacterium granulosum TaxID=33011 RepID=UPI002910E2E8|nr:2-amino-4-oxopentanoate thiolase subunit OrtB [Cutibacterium granulosum]MDU7727815.1 2-amino-4-oxopentanoate thiolase subunit OrtB [Cutibacterium granulosum]MEA5635309.1 2-amino-4-oxopentanoate thiolase subunit OrtB [Cutibacterium granulosum]MEA5659164.1 2-amino-4-oxopentanoate thiolase subunit OrtB [Cutibacterium granulosum]BDQ40563.1 PLP-dependent lyase/thiolase [Cutibacterium granulosum]